jgi:Concanavalin A-like lectin/glucanases superfamily/Secretion system C-terminal sorting domain
MEGFDEIWALGNDGKVYRATSFSTSANGAYYSFVDGKPSSTGSYINLPAFNLNSNNVTMEATVNISAATAYGGIIINRTGKTAAGLMVSAVNNNNIKITYMWNGLGWDWTGGPSLLLNQKYQLALVIEPTKATIYVDGVPYVHQVSQALEEFDGITNLAIDPYQANGRFLSMYIDDIRIWKKSLTQSEIQTVMTCKPSVQDANLVAYYDFNQLSNNRSSIIDLKGNFTLTISEQAQKDAFKSTFEITQACPITAISEETTSSVQLNAYPNPAKDILHVSGSAEIFDLVGNKVAEGTNEIKIDHLLSGIYVVKANGKSQKIVKE